jgi:hypothetical protein
MPLLKRRQNQSHLAIETFSGQQQHFIVTCNSNEVGNPAILLLPIIATLFPLISTPCLSNNSMQLLEAQGIKKGFLPLIARLPIFKG